MLEMRAELHSLFFSPHFFPWRFLGVLGVRIPLLSLTIPSPMIGANDWADGV